MINDKDMKALDLAGRSFARQSDEDARFIYAELRGALNVNGILLPPLSEFTTVADEKIKLFLDPHILGKVLDPAQLLRYKGKATEPEEQVAGEVIVLGYVILGLAALSKVRYTKSGGLEVVDGLPGLAEVLKNFPKFW